MLIYVTIYCSTEKVNTQIRNPARFDLQIMVCMLLMRSGFRAEGRSDFSLHVLCRGNMPW